jgi:hypothetical protein
MGGDWPDIEQPTDIYLNGELFRNLFLGGMQCGQRRQQQGGEEEGGGSFHAVGCLVHCVSLIVSNHWTFTARTFPAVGKPRRSCAGHQAVDSNGIRFPLARRNCFLFSG